MSKTCVLGILAFRFLTMSSIYYFYKLSFFINFTNLLNLVARTFTSIKNAVWLNYYIVQCNGQVQGGNTPVVLLIVRLCSLSVSKYMKTDLLFKYPRYQIHSLE